MSDHKENCITLDDIIGYDAPTTDMDQDMEQNQYHEEFIRKMRMTEQLEQIAKDNNFVNFDEDDDKFFIGLDSEKYAKGSQDIPQKLDFLENEKKKTDKKNLKFMDNVEVKYEPIRKNLYIESREINLLTEKEVAEFRKKHGDIKVRGIQCPKPINSWY